METIQPSSAPAPARRKAHQQAAIRHVKVAKTLKKKLVRKAAAVQRKIQAHEDLEILKGQVKIRLEETFGTGLFTENLWQSCLDGKKSQALKTAQAALAKSAKVPAEQESILKVFKDTLDRLYLLRRIVTSSIPAEPVSTSLLHPNPSEVHAGDAILHLKKTIQNKLKVEPAEITEALLNDTQQTVKREIRNQMRDLLSGMF